MHNANNEVLEACVVNCTNSEHTSCPFTSLSPQSLNSMSMVHRSHRVHYIDWRKCAQEHSSELTRATGQSPSDFSPLLSDLRALSSY